MSEMTRDDYEAIGGRFSEEVRQYREDLAAGIETAALVGRLEGLRDLWIRLCEATPTDQVRLDSDYYLFYALMAAVDVGQADEAQRVYSLMPVALRQRVDAVEEENPGKDKLWRRKS